jgi:hypothetical protein
VDLYPAVRSLALAAASNKRIPTPGLTLRAISGTDCGFHEPHAPHGCRDSLHESETLSPGRDCSLISRKRFRP